MPGRQDEHLGLLHQDCPGKGNGGGGGRGGEGRGGEGRGGEGREVRRGGG